MARPSFHLLGFPVTVTSGFVIGLLVVFSLNVDDPDFAWRLVAALAVFTLVHELGHALAARRFGAESAISLNFLVGYAVYRPTRPLSRLQRATVSAAGPLVELALGVAVLALLGFGPLDIDRLRTDPTAWAVWWAGPVLGALNLLPLMPLDGGNIAALAADVVVPGRGRQVVTYLTVAACATALAVVLAVPGLRPWSITVVLFGVFALQALGSERRAASMRRVDPTQLVAAAASAERQGWATGHPGFYPPPFGPSPFLRAEVLRRTGHETSARQLVVEALQRGGGVWVPPPPDLTEQVVPLLELLPDDAPVDNLASATVLLDLLQRSGYLRRAVEYGIRVHRAHPEPEVARRVASSLALLGDEAAAQDWRRRAAD